MYIPPSFLTSLLHYFIQSSEKALSFGYGFDSKQQQHKNSKRFTAVLEKVVEMSAWSMPLTEGKYRGLAIQKSQGSIVAQVAEITKIDGKQFHIDKYYCVIDCGQVVHPDLGMNDSVSFFIPTSNIQRQTYKTCDSQCMCNPRNIDR